jgi:hypothetical protein
MAEPFENCWMTEAVYPVGEIEGAPPGGAELPDAA